MNLLTAFIAAVVGLFESTIATLALREIRGSHWRRLAFEEAMVGTLTTSSR